MAAPPETAASAAERIVVRYSAKKLRKTFGKVMHSYSRIVTLTTERLITIDPIEFVQTNAWSWADIKEVKPHPKNPDELRVAFSKGDALELQCAHRARFATDLKRLWHAAAPKGTAVGAEATRGYPASRERRHGGSHPVVLRVLPYALVEETPAGRVLQTYVTVSVLPAPPRPPSSCCCYCYCYQYSAPAATTATHELASPSLRYQFIDLRAMGPLADTERLTCHIGGRGRCWAVDGGARDAALLAVSAACAALGVDVPAMPPLPLDQFTASRRGYGRNLGAPIGSYDVQKLSARRAALGDGGYASRKLVVTAERLVERDAASFTVVSVRPLASLYALVRPWDDARVFTLEFTDGASRTYSCASRDTVLAAVLDAAHASGNDHALVTAESSDALRLLPRDAVEEYKVRVLEWWRRRRVPCGAVAALCPAPPRPP